MRRLPTENQLRLIAAIESAFHGYYGDDLTRFDGKTFQHASDWIEAHHDEYLGICYDLKRGVNRRKKEPV